MAKELDPEGPGQQPNDSMQMNFKERMWRAYPILMNKLLANPPYGGALTNDDFKPEPYKGSL